jgi:hypothetical protein
MVRTPPESDADTAESIAIHGFKPLVRIGNVTYRVGRLRYGQYEVVRILDDVRLGTFDCYPTLTVTSATIHPAFILNIARAAARAARPSWIRRITHAIRLRASDPPVNNLETPEGPTDSEVATGGGAGAPPTHETAAPPTHETTAPPTHKTAAENVTLQKPDEKG